MFMAVIASHHRRRHRTAAALGWHASIMGGFVATAVVAAVVWPSFAMAAEEAAEAAATPEADSAAEAEDNGVFLPSDRVKERQLDRARRMLAAGDWADAAGLLDELLADERDAFLQGEHAGGTRRSIRAEATRMIAALPVAGNNAYGLLFRARAERALAEALQHDDAAGVMAVARRWFATPAGQRAAVVAAIAALESGDGRAAAAWLAGVAETANAENWGPTLAVMRAAALARAGDRRGAGEMLEAARARGGGMARIAGRELALSGETAGSGTASTAVANAAHAWLDSFVAAGHSDSGSHAGDWLQPGGDAARNAVVEASQPLLVARYRVPLTRHPEESRLLERRRRAAAADGEWVVPAGSLVAVAGTLVAQTPLGILGIDFETGKRLWLQSAAAAGSSGSDAALQASLGRVFDDATSGCLSSDGSRVFAVESHPDALTPPAESLLGAADAIGWQSGNTLTAYDVTARGRVAWRLPGRDAGEVGAAWYMGAPLVVGDDLFVLVESGGQLRLDVLDAARGVVRWSQPLADLDEQQSAANRDAFGRRLAGLTPACAEGVLVCPLGGGAVVAVEVATRSLLWAHSYRPLEPAGDPLGGGLRIRGLVGEGRDAAAPRRGGDPWPVIASGRVVLAAYDAEEVHCLGLRDGLPVWPRPPRGRFQMAGVVDGVVVLVGRDGVEAFGIDTGLRKWSRPHPAAARPSGRGIVTATRLFLPYDTPEVVEIDLADGSVAGRHAARGGAVPGTLVAHRGELISRGVDAIDVFHQTSELESRIETARHDRRPSPWADFWEGQLAVMRGDVAAGLELLRQSAEAARSPPGAVGDALAFAMKRDFGAASACWQRWSESADPAARSAPVLRAATDGFLRAGEVQPAWRACRDLLAIEEPGAAVLIADSSDAALEVRPDRWVRGRLAELASRASAAVRVEMAEEIASLVEHAAAMPEPARRRRCEDLLERLGDHPAANPIRAAFVAEVEGDAGGLTGRGREWEIRRDLLGDRGRTDGDLDDPDDEDPSADWPQAEWPSADWPQAEWPSADWPLGRVVVRRSRREPAAEQSGVGSQVVVVPLVGSTRPAIPGVAVRYDMQQRRLLVSDGYGRRVVEPLPLDWGGAAAAMPWMNQQSPIESSVVGRVLVARAGAAVAAFDIGASPGDSRLLWKSGGRQAAGRDMVSIRAVSAAGGRIARNGDLPLGGRITEPDDLAAARTVLAPPARAAGVLQTAGRSAALLDPVSGSLLWERQGLPAIVEWTGDDEVLCGCTADGRGSPVVSMRDGRILHLVDLPSRRQRLASRGRHVLAIVPLDDAPVASRVRIDRVDPVVRDARPLGEFAGAARATMIGDRHLGVFEPGGEFTVIDIDAGTIASRTRLAGGPARTEQLHVAVWRDRYLVFVGGTDSDAFDAGQEGSNVSPLQGILMASESTPPLSGCVWAVDRADGSLLWPVPATVRRHCLHLAQPADLPVLVFCRQVRAGGDGGRQEMELLCIDKRTGQAVLEQDRLPVQPHMFVGCEVVGNPSDHSITIRGANATTQPLTLEFTGRPMPPRPPYQAAGRPPSLTRGLEALERSRPTGGDR